MRKKIISIVIIVIVLISSALFFSFRYKNDVKLEENLEGLFLAEDFDPNYTTFYQEININKSNIKELTVDLEVVLDGGSVVFELKSPDNAVQWTGTVSKESIFSEQKVIKVNNSIGKWYLYFYVNEETNGKYSAHVIGK
ncbi:hypothetical protein [Acetivibrio straminisolvens]|jgi:hypothetical protein|uniref:hypothetical protein n=1 Tax=Acetivibrio straminisolvens TaxID=253314 RepID=UPI00223F7508|nr:hypothetical protein [Acetivibrio straminisolvens]